jgi:DNA-binding NarL/FixJ family response regulator
VTSELDLFVISSQPLIEGVVRLAAGAVTGLGRVVVVQDGDLAGILPGRSPAIVVLDVEPGASELTSLRSLRVDQDARVIVLAERSDGPLVLEAMRLGVFAVLRKPDGLHELSDVLAHVASGERVLPPDLELSAVDELRRFARRAQAASEMQRQITTREREILGLLAEGFTTHQIGRRLGISPRTVETHAAKLYRKLGVKTRIQAIARAASLGLVDLDT